MKFFAKFWWIQGSYAIHIYRGENASLERSKRKGGENFFIESYLVDSGKFLEKSVSL